MRYTGWLNVTLSVYASVFTFQASFRRGRYETERCAERCG